MTVNISDIIQILGVIAATAVLLPYATKLLSVLTQRIWQSKGDVEAASDTEGSLLSVQISREEVALAAGAAAGTSADLNESQLEALIDEKLDWRPVFFGTNRVYDNSADERGGDSGIDLGKFTHERSTELQTGWAYVSIPKNYHKLGRIERPELHILGAKIYEWKENPVRHFMILRSEFETKANIQNIASEITTNSNEYLSSAFIFIHGFNVQLRDAIFTAAQISYDIRFDGPTFVFSWPAKGSVLDYLYDMDSARLAAPQLAEFVTMVADTQGVDKLHIVAHSMGNLLMSEVVIRRPDLFGSAQAEILIEELVMAAPDLDQVFFESIAEKYKQFARGMTLYASSSDKAMVASRKLRANAPRLGDVTSEGPVVVDGVETIDVTIVGENMFALNHSAYSTKASTLNDLGHIMKTGKRPPEERTPTIMRERTRNGIYWKLSG